MKKTLVLILLSGGIMTANQSSGNELTRDTAAPIIQQYVSLQLPPGEVEIHAYGSLDAAAAKYMQTQGLIRIYPSKHDGSGKPLEVTELTEKGKKYLLSMYQRPSGEFIYTVKLCQAKFLRVTGIAKNQPSLARVEYEWTYDNFTPFATAYISTGAQLRSGDISNVCVKELQVPHNDALYFQLYDDGWRLSEPPDD